MAIRTSDEPSSEGIYVKQAAEEGEDVEESGAEDGVYLFRPHQSYISGLRSATHF